MIRIIDVEGVLVREGETISRGMLIAYEQYLMRHHKENDTLVLLSSKEFDDVEHMLGKATHAADIVACCDGNSVVMIGKKKWNTIKVQELYRNEWLISTVYTTHLQKLLENSTYTPKTGSHFEHRAGMLSFSIVGHKCGPADRQKYIEHDRRERERMKICNDFNKIYGDAYARPSGDLAVTLTPVGKGREQLSKFFQPGEPIVAFLNAVAGKHTGFEGESAQLAEHLHSIKATVHQFKTTEESKSYMEKENGK